jgi:hypothetical protein
LIGQLGFYQLALILRFRQHLDLQLDAVGVTDFVYDDFILITQPVDTPHHFFNRGRCQKNTFDLGNVIGSSNDTSLNESKGSATGTGLGIPLDNIL